MNEDEAVSAFASDEDDDVEQYVGDELTDEEVAELLGDFDEEDAE